MKRIVTIGGGSGQSLLLRHLRDYPIDITAIVSMVDDGGSTGQLRSALGVLPPGDVRRCLVALAQDNQALQETFNYRFTNGNLQGHTVGNIVLTSFEQSMGSCSQAVELIARLFNCKGKVMPVTDQPSTLFARLDDGTIVEGETNIDIPKHDASTAIAEVYIQPRAQANPAVLEAIKQADLIVFTIGDLFTSVIPNLLIDGITEALAATSAKLVYACNRSTKLGETHNYSALNCVEQLERYLKHRTLDYIIIDPSPVMHDTTQHIVTYNNAELTTHGITVIESAVASKDGAHIDGEKMAKAIYTLCNN